MTEKKQRMEIELKREVSTILRELGIPPHILGYEYSRSAILLGLKDPNIIRNATKVMYPEVAKMYKTTSSSVERAIRHAVELAWKKEDKKPTNVEFIATIVDDIKLKYDLS